MTQEQKVIRAKVGVLELAKQLGNVSQACKMMGHPPRRRAKRQVKCILLQKNILQPHRRQCWVIPPKANSAFVAAMEDVLAVYTRPRDPDYPLVCLDETSKQLLAETRVPIPMKAGRPARFDYEYERNGTANLFMMFAPLEGWRHVKVTDQ
jgi:hypothetical protein